MNTHVTTAGGSPGLSRYFTDRKISTKIGIGFACVLAITATISTASSSPSGATCASTR